MCFVATTICNAMSFWLFLSERIFKVWISHLFLVSACNFVRLFRRWVDRRRVWQCWLPSMSREALTGPNLHSPVTTSYNHLLSSYDYNVKRSAFPLPFHAFWHEISDHFLEASTTLLSERRIMGWWIVSSNTASVVFECGKRWTRTRVSGSVSGWRFPNAGCCSIYMYSQLAFTWCWR